MKSQKQKEILNVVAAVAAILTLIVSGAAEAKRFVIQMKSAKTFRAMNKNVQDAQLLSQFRGLPTKPVQFMNTQATMSQSLENLEMIVVEADSLEELAAIQGNPHINFIEEEVFFPAPKPVTAPFNPNLDFAPMASFLGEGELPWGILAVKAPEAWVSVGRGEGVRVMVLDTGLDRDHPDLIGRFEEGKNFFGRRRGDTAPYDYWDDVGHGTHVSGTILADGVGSGLLGVAPAARLLMGRVCGTSNCSSIAILNGVNWAIQKKADVVNMSLGGPMGSSSARKAYQKAASANVVIVAASGNDGKGKVSFPAAYPATIAVGAVDPELKKAKFSQWGPELDVVAPGVEVYSAVPQGTGREAVVKVDLGEGPTKVKTEPMQGSSESQTPSSGDLVFAGLGKKADFTRIDVRGKMALIRRGEISFADKAKHAISAGASGVLIFNHEPGLIRGGLTTDGSQVAVPVVMIEQVVGEALVSRLDQGSDSQASIATMATDYASMQGTSMASPHVAGVVALIRQANPNLNVEQVRTILKRTTVPLGPNGNNEYGAGLVDAEMAVATALSIH